MNEQSIGFPTLLRSALASAWALCVLSGCVTSPTHEGEVPSRNGVTMAGYASAGGALLQVRAWDYVAEVWEPIVELHASGDAYTGGRSQAMYPWTTGPLVLGQRHWSAACDVEATARLQVAEYVYGIWQPLHTFTQSGIDCIGDRLQANPDEGLADVGYACTTDEQTFVEVTAPPACLGEPPEGASPLVARPMWVGGLQPGVTLRVVDGDRLWTPFVDDASSSFTVPLGQEATLRLDATDADGVDRVELRYLLMVWCDDTSYATDQTIPASPTRRVNELGVSIALSRASFEHLASRCTGEVTHRLAFLPVGRTERWVRVPIVFE